MDNVLLEEHVSICRWMSGIKRQKISYLQRNVPPKPPDEMLILLLKGSADQYDSAAKLYQSGDFVKADRTLRLANNFGDRAADLENVWMRGV